MSFSNSFKVTATVISAISGAEISYTLVGVGNGVVFVNDETLKQEEGTFVDSNENKFAALDKFRSIFKDMKPSFQLR